MVHRIPYAKQSLDEDDVAAVVESLQSDWLTTGPRVEEFERLLAERGGSRYAVAFNSGTAGLHAAYFAAGFGPGDELITTPITFAATANAALYLGGRVTFADIESEATTIDPADIRRRLSERTKVIAPVDFAGHPSRLDEIIKIAREAGAVVVEDACHALGAVYRGRRVGSIADMTVFSFHPVKHITTGEGGAVLTDDPDYYERLKLFRSHGITKDPEKLIENHGPWYYEMHALGYNYRITDIQCALGISQLRRLDRFLARRREIAARYGELLRDLPLILPKESEGVESAWHLYVVRLRDSSRRRGIVEALHQRGIMVQVHYIPVYRHPYYRTYAGHAKIRLERAEAYYASCLSLPLYPAMTDEDVKRVADSLHDVL